MFPNNCNVSKSLSAIQQSHVEVQQQWRFCMLVLLKNVWMWVILSQRKCCWSTVRSLRGCCRDTFCSEL